MAPAVQGFKYEDETIDAMPIRTIAGDCIVRFDGRRTRRQRGRVCVLVKPDNTVLVHDADGYQPVAWLTRPAELTFTRDPLWLVAIDGGETLRVEAAGEVVVAEHDVSEAGIPVGDCRCGGPLVRAGGTVVCLDGEERFPLPNGSMMLEECCACGLPQFRVERGESFETASGQRCLDTGCDRESPRSS